MHGRWCEDGEQCRPGRPSVLHVITTIDRGGAENHLIDLVEEQRALGLAVPAVAWLKGSGYWQDRLAALGVRAVRLPMARYGDPRAVLALRRLVARTRPDIVHTHMPPAELYGKLALASLAGAPARVISKHNDERFFDGPGAAATERWCAHGASAIICISAAVQRYFGARLPQSMHARLTTVHYGLSPASADAVPDAALQALRAQWGCGTDTLLVGTVARMAPQKALHVLLDGFARWRSSAAGPTRLVIVGRGPLEAELRAQAARLGIADAVVFAGFREDIPTVMAAFDLFALTSDYEGFGLVLLEAMAARRAILATAVSAIPEIVQDGRTGLLVPRGDAAAVAQAIARLSDPGQRRAAGAAGRARLESAFTPRRMAEATLQVYRRALLQAPAPDLAHVD